ncbi:MAG: ABC transporter substrate-binding protein, partial [Anaerolineae bacterium]|nr:ABC transporter substrate-binding protein [Anaerolineae bacterium]
IIQHNTSGFVTLHEQDPISRPADFAGLRYGGFGQPDLEKAIINTLMICDGAEPDSFEYVDVGYADAFELMERDRIDFAWMYYGWTGVEGELRGLDLDTVMLMDYLDCVPDYYTPIVITSRAMIEEQPDVVAAFVQATARGFAYAITNPAEAADILISAVPEADADLIRAETGFAIGGVAPVGHLHPIPTWADPRLLDFPLVWAAAGTPRHIFALPPQALIALASARTAPFTA